MNLNFLSTFLKCFFITLFIFISALTAQAEQRGSPSAMSAKSKRESVNYRILANYDYIMTSPGDLNSFSSGLQWSGINTPTSFSNLNGYSLGAGFLVGAGFMGLEYAYGLQELPSTFVPPASTVQYILDYQTAYLVYDWVFNSGTGKSYELGGGVGYAMKFQYRWLVKTAGTTSELIWQDTPMVFKARANYNYHFSNTFRFRLGATYEFATSSNLKADSSILGAVSGQTLRSASGQDVKVDISGFRLNAGLVLAF